MVEARGSADAPGVGRWGKRTVKDDDGSGVSNFYRVGLRIIMSLIWEKVNFDTQLEKSAKQWTRKPGVIERYLAYREKFGVHPHRDDIKGYETIKSLRE